MAALRPCAPDDPPRPARAPAVLAVLAARLLAAPAQAQGGPPRSRAAAERALAHAEALAAAAASARAASSRPPLLASRARRPRRSDRPTAAGRAPLLARPTDGRRSGQPGGPHAVAGG